MQHQRYWLHSDGTVDNRVFDFEQPRPVVVIDPEDEDQAEAITKAFVAAGVWRVIPASIKNAHTHRREQIRAALREYAKPTPPKPDEPTGLGAVVEDDQGVQWVRFESTTGWWWRTRTGLTKRYEDIPAVEKLSEGVS